MAICKEDIQKKVKEGDIFDDFSKLCWTIGTDVVPRHSQAGEFILDRIQQWCELEFQDEQITIKKFYDVPKPITNLSKYKKLGGIYIVDNSDGTQTIWYANHFPTNGNYSVLEVLDNSCPYSFQDRARYYIKLFSGENITNKLEDEMPQQDFLCQNKVKALLKEGDTYESLDALCQKVGLENNEAAEKYLAGLCNLKYDDGHVTITKVFMGNTFTIAKESLHRFLGVDPDVVSIYDQFKKLSEVYNWVIDDKDFITCEYARKHKFELSKFELTHHFKHKIYFTNNWEWVSARKEFPVLWYAQHDIEVKLKYLGPLLLSKPYITDTWWKDLKSGKLTILNPEIGYEFKAVAAECVTYYEGISPTYPDDYKFKYVKGLYHNVLEVYDGSGNLVAVH